MQFKSGEFGGNELNHDSPVASTAACKTPSTCWGWAGLTPTHSCDSLQNVAQHGNEGVDAAAQVLQVHQKNVKGVHHGVRGMRDAAVQTEHRDGVPRVTVVR